MAELSQFCQGFVFGNFKLTFVVNAALFDRDVFEKFKMAITKGENCYVSHPKYSGPKYALKSNLAQMENQGL